MELRSGLLCAASTQCFNLGRRPALRHLLNESSVAVKGLFARILLALHVASVAALSDGELFAC